MKKKVAIVVCAFPPQGGGIGNNAFYHAGRLSPVKYDVTVFTPKYRYLPQESVAGFKLVYLKSWLSFGKAGFLFALWRHLKGFDIVHLYYPFFGTDLLVWFYILFHRHKKLIVHYQMDPVGQGWQKYFFKFYLQLFLPIIVRAADKVLVLSLDNARHCYLNKFLAGDGKKFVVVPNGIDSEIFKPQEPDQTLIKKYNIEPNESVMAFVGGLDSQHYFKGVDILLKAFAEIGKGKLLIIGDGNLKAKFQAQAKALGVDDNVVFTGWIDNQDLPKYYSIVDIFILPSTARTESFGIVTAEAQACGVPAIVSNWPGSRETIEDGLTGLLIEPGQVDDLVDKLRRLLSDDGLRKNMGEAGAVRAKKMYAWNKVIEQIENIYDNL